MADQQQLPMFFGQQISKTELALSGTIQSVDLQPPRAMTHLGETVVMIVVGTVGGAGLTSDDIGVTYKNKVSVFEAHELEESMAERLLKQLRDQDSQVIDRRLGRASFAEKAS